MRELNMRVLYVALGTLLVSGLQAVYANGPPGGINQIPPIPDVVARVNGSEISAKHIKFEFMRVLKNTRVPMTSAQKDMVLRKVIDKEVARELIYQEGQKLSFKVDEKIVEAELMALRIAYKNGDDFDKALVERNITEGDLKRSIEVDVLAKIILEKQFKGKVKEDDADGDAVQKYYEANKKEWESPMAFRARHVLIMPFTPDMMRSETIEDLQAKKEELREKAYKKILEIQNELKNGTNIEELAKKYSHDESTAENGGDLGFFYADRVEKAFVDAVAKLEVGEVTDVVETSYGFHLIELIDTDPGGYAPFEDMKEIIREEMFKEKARDHVSDYIASLRKKAKIEVLY